MKPPLLMVGNFLSGSTGVRGICEELAGSLTARGWSVITTSRRKNRVWRLLDMLATTIARRRRYSVAQVDVFSGPAFVWAEAVVAVLRLLRCPVVLTLHGGNLPSFAARNSGRVERLLGSAVTVTAPSYYLKEQLSRYRPNVRVLPNGLDLALYPVVKRKQAAPRLIWVRALHRIYNPVLAVDVVSRLARSFPDITLHMVGPDKGDGSGEALAGHINELGMQGRVSVMGSIKKRDVPAALQWGDVFLNTTNIDNTPVTVLEAMACGLCVVTTNVGGLPYLLEDEKDALLVPPGDPEAMAAAVTRVLTEPDLANRLSVEGRKKAEGFDSQWILHEWEALLEDAGAFRPPTAGRSVLMAASSMMRVYEASPPWIRSCFATARGLQLRYLRYGGDTNDLMLQAVEREIWSPERWQAWRDEVIPKMLHHAATTVPYYREHWSRRRAAGDRSSLEEIRNWPLLSKEEVRQQPRAFLSDNPENRHLHHEQTSGTTGKPMTLWFSRATLHRFYALYDSRVRSWNGVYRNEPWAILGGQPVVPGDSSHPPYWVHNWAMHQLYLSANHISDATARDFCRSLEDARVTHIVSYPSSLTFLASACVRQGLQGPPVKAVIANAEPLFGWQKDTIEQWLGLRPIETYGMGEKLTGASECSGGRLHLWPELGYIEVLDADRSAVGPGQSGDLVCTGLLCSEMPLVRYIVGDRVALGDPSDACVCGRTLPTMDHIEGRSADMIIAPDGRRVFWLNPVFYGIPVVEAQVIQEDAESLRVLVVPGDGFDESAGAALTERLRQKVGDMRVDIELVKKIPRGANGKFKPVVCLVTPSQGAAPEAR